MYAYILLFTLITSFTISLSNEPTKESTKYWKPVEFSVSNLDVVPPDLIVSRAYKSSTTPIALINYLGNHQVKAKVNEDRKSLSIHCPWPNCNQEIKLINSTLSHNNIHDTLHLHLLARTNHYGIQASSPVKIIKAMYPDLWNKVKSKSTPGLTFQCPIEECNSTFQNKPSARKYFATKHIALCTISNESSPGAFECTFDASKDIFVPIAPEQVNKKNRKRRKLIIN